MYSILYQEKLNSTSEALGLATGKGMELGRRLLKSGCLGAPKGACKQTNDRA